MKTGVLIEWLKQSYDLHNATLSIININGKVLKSEIGEHANQIDIKTIKPGLYLLKIQNDKMYWTRKIIIE